MDVDRRREQGRKSSQRYKESIRTLVRDAKSVPCSDCKLNYPYYVMDFDHRPGETKSFTLGKAHLYGSRRTAEEEIAKCDVVCANCHRIRTWERGQTTMETSDAFQD